MANTKQAKKMVRKIKRKTAFNNWWKSQVRGTIKSIDQILSETATPDATKLKASYSTLQKQVDKAAKNGIYHKNKASRIKERINKKVKAATSKPK